ncbi:DMT family transporter [Desulfobacula sp.]|uniref:DMT family transporter n=1 Tax=Desulfobacula sp. TaxID=2593537 RepID=UPI00261F148B|nr:DMT family transporter [Desulfobacula sp.]
MSDILKKHSVFAGYLFAIGATAMWSGNFIVARGLSDSIPPVSLAFCRWMVAVIVFTPFAIKNLIQEWPIIKKHITYFSITSFLGITTFNTLIYFAAQTTTAMNLSLISITFPIFIILFSRFLYNEVLTVKKGVGITIVLSGVLFLITKGKISTLLSISFTIGDVWMLTASIIFAVYSLFLKNKPEGLSIKALQLSTFILGLVFLFPFFLWELSTVHQSFLNQTTIPAILYVGIFASLCAFVLWNKSIVILGPSKAGMVYYTLPLFAGFLGYIFLHESIGMIHFYSMIFIFSGIIVTNHESKNKK